MQILPTLRKLLRARRNKDIVIFILFFVLATIIWYGHAMQSVRTTRVPVSIRYIGKPAHIGLGDEGLPNQVMIEVRDAGHRLVTYHQEPLQITIDLHQYIHGDSGTIQIPSNALRGSIKAALQANSNLISTDPEEIRCSYFKEQEKTVKLELDADWQLAAGYQIIGQPHIQQKITIYGKKETLNTIESVRTQHLVMHNLSDTVRTNVALDLPKGVRAADGAIPVEVHIEQYTEKRFDVPVVAKNVPEGSVMHLFPATVQVNIRIGVNHATQLQASDLRVTCVCPKMPKSKISLDLKYPNDPHITAAWVYPAEVEYYLEDKEEGK